MVSWKVGVGLLVVLVGLGILVFRPSSTPTPPALIPCDSFNSVYAKLEGGGKVLEMDRPKVDEAWHMIQPQGAPDRPTLEFDLNNIQSVKVQNTIDRPQGTYGLDAPHVVVTCRVTGGASYTLTVGEKTFDGSAYYARKKGDAKVYVISAVAVDGFDHTIAEPPIKQSPVPAGASSPGPPGPT